MRLHPGQVGWQSVRLGGQLSYRSLYAAQPVKLVFGGLCRSSTRFRKP